jgi:hypothetical protein
MSQGLSPSFPQDEVEASHREPLSRSPHPYYRRSIDLSDRLLSARPSRPNALPTQNRQPKHGESLRTASEAQSFLGTSTSTSDSGTEADDEKPLLKALTAPPLRPRKGLKGSRSPGLDFPSSPLLTPSPLEDDKSRLLVGHAQYERRKEKLGKSEVVTKLVRRRRQHGRIEIFRRSVELGLILFVGYICIREPGPAGLKGI